ncbi:MAG: ribulose-phosphate 3-epimerase [Candidatus Margulisiibacteriota bacterium]|jgi:ribulose-phosphate 3-epimerase
MSRPIKIAPSILSADFAHLLDDVLAVEKAGADELHIDVMDGHFVKNITIGPLVVKSLKGKTSLPLDVHLMITDPDFYAPKFAEAGADHIGIHVETCQDINASIDRLKKLQVRPYVVLNPDTPLSTIKDILNDIDLVLIMTVFPGFAGQAFIKETLPTIRELRSLAPSIDIKVDGGINQETAVLAREAGANILVAGSAIFGSADLAKTIKELRG